MCEITDVHENKTLASYMGDGLSIELIKTPLCHVGGVTCNGLTEFMKLSEPYVKEQDTS